MNSVQIIGRLTADPELRQTQSGISCCRFTIAAPENGSRTYMNYYALTQEVLKAYRPEVAAKGKSTYLVPCNPSDLSLEEQEDISEMLEAIIDTIHYAKYKRSKKA